MSIPILSPMVNITWLDSTNITITGLEVFLSGESNNGSLFSALVFINTTSFLSKLSLFGNDGFQSTAIRAHSSVVELSDMMVSGATSMHGAALIAFNSTINLIGQSYFVNNTATQGGAMVIIKSVANFHGNVSFVDNTAITSNFDKLASGGAIYCDNSVLSFSSSILIQRNQAVAKFPAMFVNEKGGGILAWLSILIFITSSSVDFTENTATFYGGGLSIIESEVIVRGKALFEANYAKIGGGALSGETNSKILCKSSGDGIVFRNNHVGNVIQTYGGAILTDSSNLELEGIILFKKNMAGTGGAIYSNFGFLRILTYDFYNNTAIFSGVVYITGMYAIFDGKNNFQWNSVGTTDIVSVNSANATFNGENNFVNNNVTKGIGSLSLSSSNSLIGGNLTFSRNYAIHGGGLYGILSNLTIFGNNLFIGNSAVFGGGMKFSWCNLNITGQASFVENTAKGFGSAAYISASNATIDGSMNISGGLGPLSLYGSLYFYNSTIALTGVLILENNFASSGGAIIVRNSEVNFLGCIQCLNNSAHSSGGALLARNSKINFRNSSGCNLFQSNVAGDRGGGIYAINSTISLSGLLRFFSNSARRGGVIAIDSSSKLVLTQNLSKQDLSKTMPHLVEQSFMKMYFLQFNVKTLKT